MIGHYIAKFSNEGPMGSSKTNFDHLDDMSRGIVLYEFPAVSVVSCTDPSMGIGVRPADIHLGDMELVTSFDKVGPRTMNSFYQGLVIEGLKVYELSDVGGQKAVIREMSAEQVHIVGILWQYNGLTQHPHSAENSILVVQVRASKIKEAVLSVSEVLGPEGNVASELDSVKSGIENV